MGCGTHDESWLLPHPTRLTSTSKPHIHYDEPFQSKQPNHDQPLQSKNNHTITACIIGSQRLRPRRPTLRITRKTPPPINTSRKEISSEIRKKILGHREPYNGMGVWEAPAEPGKPIQPASTSTDLHDPFTDLPEPTNLQPT